MVSVSAAKSEPPTPRSRALARAAQQREREWVARRRERATRHRERRERRSEEFRLREQQGLSSPDTEEYSSSDEEEEEEEVRGQALPDRWELGSRRQGQKAKEADELKTALDAKVAALATADQLRQERASRQEAEGQLQQERTALADARSALEQERTTRETAQKSLEERDADVSRLDGELIALSIANADHELSLKEQGATVVSLQQAVEAGHRALEVEKKQVEGESPFRLLFC
jgi:hypothetical protein